MTKLTMGAPTLESLFLDPAGAGAQSASKGAEFANEIGRLPSLPGADAVVVTTVQQPKKPDDLPPLNLTDVIVPCVWSQ